MIATVSTILRNNCRSKLRELPDDCEFSVASNDAENDRKFGESQMYPTPQQCARTHFTSCAAVFI
jgi:hypothetical protein